MSRLSKGTVALPRLTVTCEKWPLAKAFNISRGAKSSAEPVVATIARDGLIGRGECLPYARYGETVEGVAAAIRALASKIQSGMDRSILQNELPAGAARNALDCALWDLEAKESGRRVWQLAGLAEPAPLTTAYTIGLDGPDAMGSAAYAERHRPLLKIKLGREGAVARVAAVRAGAPEARLIVDANEAWTPEMVEPVGEALADLGVEAIEQPLPAGADEALAKLSCPIPVYADESCHDRAGLSRIVGRYDGINIKLDKAGGLTEALALRREAESAGLGIMVGCMVATSLSMAPAMLLAQGAAIVDLDGPLLLACDRENGMHFAESRIFPPGVALWG